MPRRRLLLAPLLALALLAACAGGSDTERTDRAPTDSGSAQTPDAPQAVEPPVPPPEPRAEPLAPTVSSPDPTPGTPDTPPPFRFVFGGYGRPDRVGIPTFISLDFHAEERLPTLEPGQLPELLLLEGPDGTTLRRPWFLTGVRTQPDGSRLPFAWGVSVTFPTPGRWRSQVVLADGTTVNFPSLTVRAASALSDQPGLPRGLHLNSIALVDADGGNLRVPWDADSNHFGWISQPDRLVFWREGQAGLELVAGDPATGALTPLLSLERGADFPPTIAGLGDPTIAIAPNGRRIFIARQPTDPQSAELSLFDVATGTHTPINVAGVFRRPYPIWSPDGTHVFVRGRGDGSLRFLIIDAETLTTVIDYVGTIAFTDVDWTPDSRYLFLSRSSKTAAVLRFSIAEGTVEPLLAPLKPSGLGGWHSTIAISPDGQHLAISYADVPARERRLVVGEIDATDAELRATPSVLTIPIDNAAVYATPFQLGLAWAPNGRRLAVGSADAAYVIGTTDGSTRLADRGSPYTVTGFTWSSDGTQLRVERRRCVYACDGGEGSLTVVDLPSGQTWLDEAGEFFCPGEGPPFFVRDAEGLFHCGPVPFLVIAHPWQSFDARLSPQGTTYAVLIQQALFSPAQRLAIQPDGSGRRVLTVENRDLPGYRRYEPPPTITTSPDGSWTVRDDHEGVYVTFIGGTERLLSDLVPSDPPILWSPDGAALAYVTREPGFDGIVVAPLQGPPYLLLRGGGGRLTLIDWTTEDGISYRVGSLGP